MSYYFVYSALFLKLILIFIYYSSSGIENCATVGYEAIDYFSSGFGNYGNNKSQLDKNLTSSKRQGNNVQNRNGGQKSNIGGGNFSIFESGNLVGEGMMDLGHVVVERPPPKR